MRTIWTDKMEINDLNSTMALINGISQKMKKEWINTNKGMK